VVTEHNLDVVACADWLIDLGPEGGEIADQGTPETIARAEGSHTGHDLKEVLGRAIVNTARKKKRDAAATT
jgi:excinuclease ABC subunit A